MMERVANCGRLFQGVMASRYVAWQLTHWAVVLATAPSTASTLDGLLASLAMAKKFWCVGLASANQSEGSLSCTALPTASCPPFLGPNWVAMRATSSRSLAASAVLMSWMARMKAIGHGSVSPCTAEEALRLAHSATPAALPGEVFQDEHDIALGTRVVIAADNFGLEPTEGELVAATRTRYTLRRTDPRAGTVHVHFPRIGYVLRVVKA